MSTTPTALLETTAAVPNTTASVGIIGGADGPTAIFVTGPQPNWGLFVLIAAGCIGAVTAGILLLWKAGKRR